MSIIGKVLLNHRLKDAEEDDSNESLNKPGINSLVRTCKINNWVKTTHKTHARDHLIGRLL